MTNENKLVIITFHYIELNSTTWIQFCCPSVFDFVNTMRYDNCFSILVYFFLEQLFFFFNFLASILCGSQRQKIISHRPAMFFVEQPFFFLTSGI